MNNVVEYFDTIEVSFRRSKMLTVAALVCSALISIGSLVFAFSYVGSNMDRIYIMDGTGQAFSADAASGAINRDLECRDHVRRFHELMFNLSPSSEAIERNLDRALVMADRSAYEYYSDLAEKDYYRRLVSASIVQQIVVDSVKVNTGIYPYQSHTYGTIYLMRESNITTYAFESTGQLVEMGRSENNPHGLMLERFNVIRNERMETRRR